MSATSEISSTPVTRGDLRLRMVAHAGRQSLDGGWWPYSRDLICELRDLAQGFPDEHGRITRALYSPPDWDTSPRRVDLGTKILKVGSFPEDDTHVIVVQTANRERLTLLVVPPSFTPAQGEEALLAASTPRNAHSGTEVLGNVTDDHDAVPAERWTRSEDGTPQRPGHG